MHVLLIGCGRLGRSLLQAWHKHAGISQLVVVQPSLSAQTLLEQKKHITFINHPNQMPHGFMPDMIVIAIKPQQIPKALVDYTPYAHNAIVVSLATGTTLANLATYLNTAKQFARLMPNLAVQIGQSANLAYLPKNDLETQQKIEHLFTCTGPLFWLDSEVSMDELTPISGSGPAYFFLFSENLIQTAIQLGTPAPLARKLVQQTLLGSALLASKNANFEEMIGSVASKGGITEEALKILKPSLPQLIHQACAAAFQRVLELKQ